MRTFEGESLLNLMYHDDQETKNKVFEKVLEFFIKTQCFNGESVMQNDENCLEGPELLAELVDVFGFVPMWDY